MVGLELHLFGVPRIERDSATVAVERRKTLALLAYLAVAGRAHGRDALDHALVAGARWGAAAAVSFATFSLTCSAPSAKAGWTPKAIR